jgi:hypothetical protein
LSIGKIQFLVEGIFLAIAQIAIRKNNLFSKRERNDSDFRPLTIKFDRDVLQEKSGNHHLVSVLTHTERMGVGVFHANPYVHLFLTDFRDGSRFTLYSTSDHSLELVPSFRASVSSIMRIYRAISERFASCEMVDSVTPQYSLDDFFTNEDASQDVPGNG